VKARRSIGFSLIELLVVLLVIVLLTSVVSVNVGRGGADLSQKDDVRQFAARMMYALSEAELTGSEFGVAIVVSQELGDVRYRAQWLRRFDQGWAAPTSARDVFEPFVFEPGIELVLQLDDQADVDFELVSDLEMPTPQIQFYAGGETTPGQLDWLDASTGALLYRLTWDLFGRVEVLPRGEEQET
jgi:general secretion pathway protein H